MNPSTHRHPDKPGPFAEHGTFIPLECFSGFFIKYKVSIDVCINVSVFMPIPSGLYYYCAIIQLEIRDGNTSINSFIAQDWFSYTVKTTPMKGIISLTIFYLYIGGLHFFLIKLVSSQFAERVYQM